MYWGAIKPWFHQERSFQIIVDAVKKKDSHPCISCPTGGGKSEIFTAVIRWAIANNKRVGLFLVRNQLFSQTIDGFIKRDIPFGTHAAKFREYEDADAPVQVCMLQTLSRKAEVDGTTVRGLDVVIVDEAHQQSEKTATRIFEAFKRQGATLCGMTATPVEVNHLYTDCHQVAFNSELRNPELMDGRPAHLPCYVARGAEINTEGIKRQATGEFTQEEVMSRWNSAKHSIFGNVLAEYHKHNPTQTPTLCFAPGVQESIWLCERFAKSGVPAAHIDGDDCVLDGRFYKSEPAVRKEIISRLRESDIKIVSNRFVCLDSQTEVLTRRGWVGKDEVKGDDLVANWDDGVITFELPSRIVRRSRRPGERMVVLETPRRSIRVTEDHELLYKTNVNEKYRKTAASNLVGKECFLPVSGGVVTETQDYHITKYCLQFEEEDRNEEVWCVTVRTGNIVTRRKGSVTIMGNCREGIDVPELGHLILATPIGSLVSYVQVVGRVLRYHPSLKSVTVQDHGGNWYRFGSPNEDRDWSQWWDLTSGIISSLHEAAVKDGEKSLPIACPECHRLVAVGRKCPCSKDPVKCPKCGADRRHGTDCPKCDWQIRKPMRMIHELNGELRVTDDEPIKRRQVTIRHNTEEIWKSCYFRAKNSKNRMTFNQAYGLFFYENHYYPPREMPFMPQRQLDWYLPVKDVPYQRLRSEQ